MAQSAAARVEPVSLTAPQKTVLSLFQETVARQPNATAARSKVGGVYQPTTWAEMAKQSKEVSLGLMALGINPEDRVCLLSGTRLEWVIADLGILGAAAITVPIYQSNPAADCQYIIDNCGAVAVIVDNDKQLAKVKNAKVKHVFSIEKTSDPQVLSLSELQEKGRTYGEQHPRAYEERTAQLRPDQPLTIIYTSGTTGAPKGAVLTHHNMVYEATVIPSLDILNRDDDQLLFLPLAHVFAKVLECAWLQLGHVMSFSEGLEQLVQNMGEARPTMMGAVPRIYEKVYAKVVAGGTEKGGPKAALFKWALSVEEKVGELERQGKQPSGALALQWKLAERLVFSKIKDKLHALFGGRIRGFVSGGAPLSPKLASFFRHCDIVILEGFGMTETSAGSSINLPTLNKLGTVGKALPGTEIKIAADGEILIKGPGVMLGYYNLPEATKEAIVDGWMHTGDIGELDADGYLKITDRKKDLIITAGGKNVAPQNIENTLKTIPLISQIVVLGDKQKYLAALITLNADNAKKFAQDNGITGTELHKEPKIREALQQAIDAFNATQASYQALKKFAILPHDFSQDTGELTPKMSIKRKVVVEKYKDVVSELFSG